ncbi:MAG TPA: ASCH domain-containing protein [Gemmatimonadaceae bacterium]|nr:ASCH domain-containing protein [Gemmatimonadaceae bacterium]
MNASDGLISVLTIGHDARQGGDLGQPAAVGFPLDFDRERHERNVPSGLLSKQGAAPGAARVARAPQPARVSADLWADANHRPEDEDMDPSVHSLWADYLAWSGQPSSAPLPAAWHFCDNERDADACARLVLAGRKRATAPSLWFFELNGLLRPSMGNLDIVTNWKGIAQCIIRTTAVHIVRFQDVSDELARLEGEGDGLLESWRAIHWAYYQRELDGTKYAPTEDMPIVCQYFEVAFPQGPTTEWSRRA